MFGALIRRKPTAAAASQELLAFDSTTFSLTTAVPRPAERRDEERVMPILRIAKLTAPSGEQLIRIRNVSAGGLMAEAGRPVSVGDLVTLEMSNQRIPSSIVWTRDGTIGVKFEQNLDLGELLAGRKPRHGVRLRPPRLEVQCRASVRIGKLYYTVDVQNISLGGLKVEPIEEYCVGRDVVVVVESLRPVKGNVRWFSERQAGIVFDKPLSFDELAEWIGKRLEIASLKASHRPS